MHMPMTGGGHGQYVRSWHGEGTRLVVWHMWPMVFMAWMIFMVGMLFGAKKTVMMQGMSGMMGRGGGGMPHGMMGMRKMMHHHHGMGGPCGCGDAGEQYDKGQDRPEGGG